MAQDALNTDLLSTSPRLVESESLILSFHSAMSDQPTSDNGSSFSVHSRAGSTYAPEMDNDLKARMMGPDAAPGPKRIVTLLDLPVEILEKIVKEVRSTQDLTALARTCSILHALAIPSMYSRFDIIWPDEMSAAEVGVDALSYGLATLVMGEDVFTYNPPRYSGSHCSQCGSCIPPPQLPPKTPNRKLQSFPSLRRGNAYAQFTRHFSIGNGPDSGVLEYKANKDTGKMLGTLVALAVARMVNLESFTWDMPTGVVRDVWIALSSLADRPGHDCRLESVWVRWHDNSENRSSISIAPAAETPLTPYESIQKRYGHVEYPTFSVLPPLKSLTVLDIDEAAYLDEMEILIRRSRPKLRELRIGMASKVAGSHWVEPFEERLDKPVPANESAVLGWPRFGGVLSILMQEESEEWYLRFIGLSKHGQAATEQTENPIPAMEQLDLEDTEGATPELSNEHQSTNPNNDDKTYKKGGRFSTSKKKSAKLQLETLELERVILLHPVLTRALNWCCLTSLTILHCQGHEKLWRGLRRQFSPDDSDDNKPSRYSKRGLGDENEDPTNQYALKLKSLRTDCVSPYLMLFLKEAIAPNSLEQFIIQEGDGYDSVVPVEAIYRHVIRRQRASLKVVLVDATRRNDMVMTVHWRKWMFTREMLSFITSGRMPQLQELGMGIERHDWHFLLQRLPDIPHLKALHMHHIGNTGFIAESEMRELALQMLDIVTLRTEIELCYVGIGSKCYEIYEVNSSDDIKSVSPPSDYSVNTGAAASHNGSDENNEGEETEEEDGLEDEEADDGDGDESDGFDESNSVEYDDYSDEDGSNDVGYSEGKVQLNIREIIFYDEKITIFKARHRCL